jgi:hypothetical protein
MDTNQYSVYNGKAIKRTGWGFVASILQCEAEMGRIMNNVAYEMAKSRHDEWVKALYKYHLA